MHHERNYKPREKGTVSQPIKSFLGFPNNVMCNYIKLADPNHEIKSTWIENLLTIIINKLTKVN